MKKSVFIALIFGLILTGCSLFIYEVLPTWVVWSNNNIWWSEDRTSRRVRLEAIFEDHTFGVSIDFYEKIRFSRLDPVKDSIAILFYSFPRFNELTGYKYQFDSSKVYVTTSSQKYHLKVIDYETGEPIEYDVKDIKQYNMRDYYKTGIVPLYGVYRYYLPITCEQLDGASFEISGIYQNGVELPPIQFQVLLTNAGMKSCVQSEKETKE